MAFKQGKLVNFSVISMLMFCLIIVGGKRYTLTNAQRWHTVSRKGLFLFVFFSLSPSPFFRRCCTHIVCYVQTNERKQQQKYWGGRFEYSKKYTPKPGITEGNKSKASIYIDGTSTKKIGSDTNSTQCGRVNEKCSATTQNAIKSIIIWCTVATMMCFPRVIIARTFWNKWHEKKRKLCFLQWCVDGRSIFQYICVIANTIHVQNVSYGGSRMVHFISLVNWSFYLT